MSIHVSSAVDLSAETEGVVVASIFTLAERIHQGEIIPMPSRRLSRNT